MVKIPGLNRLETFPGIIGARKRADQVLGKDLLQEIRRLKVTTSSDAGLRDTIASLGREGHGGQDKVPLPTIFAVVNESISRRQGAWRFFDSASPAMANQIVQKYHGLAERISLTLDYERAIDEWVDKGSRCWESFSRAVAPVLDRHGSDPQERILVQAILFVSQRSQSEYAANILLPACFYQTLRASDRDGVLAFQVTDEQVLAGILLYQGKIVEMNAGEGKTIAAVFPSVLHAVHGRTVHVITANDYLAGRDADWLAPIYESLGLSVSAVLDVMDESERRFAYGKDVVYGALREFGFDYMRDNLKLSAAEIVQRNLDVAIVDEADHALIDEANIPMIISGGSGVTPKITAKLRSAIERLINLQSAAVSTLEKELVLVPFASDAYFQLLAKLYLGDPDHAELIRAFSDDPRCYRRVLRVISTRRVEDEYDRLISDLYYWIDDDGRSLCLTEKGLDFVESRLGPLFDDLALQERISSIQTDYALPLAFRRKEIDKLNRQIARRQDQMHQVVRMLWGYVLLKKDLDYLVRDDRVVLIDKYTGRGRSDTRYHYGLQAAIEVKEGVPVQPDHEVLGRISVRGYLSQYGHVSGMTGTAMGSKTEFERAYGLDVVVIPPSKPVKRDNLEPRMYHSKQDKLQAIVEEVRFCHQMGRPVLIGAHSIEECEAISKLLHDDGIRHNLLNAVNDLEEDRIIQEAGLFGAVTVATDMAGRGTDIILETVLDGRITDRYASLVGELLAEGVGAVTLNCPNKDAAEVLVSAIGKRSQDCLVAAAHFAGRSHVIVSTKNEDSQARDVSREVSLDFGLGLYVIGAGTSDSARVDHQLMGRSGRQGDFGASRFFVSSEDRPLNFGLHSLKQGSLANHVEKLQQNAEKDAESRRARIEEYTRVLEAQSLDYYRSRKEILGMEIFQPFLHQLAAGKATQLAQRYFPKLLVDDYPLQFAGLREELELDYGVDASGLQGLDLNLLEDEIAVLIKDKLDRSRERFTGEKFEKLSKLLYLQTGDELWRDHMSHIQSLVLGTQLLGHNGSGDLAAYTLTSFESYDDFQARIKDSFLPRLAAFPSGSDGEPQPPRLELFDDVIKILG
jgi:preprotein translocase subunit SecA